MKNLNYNISTYPTYPWIYLEPGTTPAYKPGPGISPYLAPFYIDLPSTTVQFPSTTVQFTKLNSGIIINKNDILSIKKIDEDKWEILFKGTYLPISFTISAEDYKELVYYLTMGA